MPADFMHKEGHCMYYVVENGPQIGRAGTGRLEFLRGMYQRVDQYPETVSMAEHD